MCKRKGVLAGSMTLWAEDWQPVCPGRGSQHAHSAGEKAELRMLGESASVSSVKQEAR